MTSINRKCAVLKPAMAIAALAAALAANIANTATAGQPCVPAWYPYTSGGEIGVDHTVRLLTEWNGDLIAAGEFTTAGGQTVNHIARWDGSPGNEAWHPLTSGGQIGVNNSVLAMTVWKGDLIVSGQFTTAGGQTVNNLARWDGSAWHPVTPGGLSGIQTLAVWNGDLIAGGFFSTAGGETVNFIARWDGSAWHPFTSGGQTGTSGPVYELTVWNDNLIVGGGFATAGGQTVNNIARWDDSAGNEAWHPFTSGGQIGVSGTLRTMTVWNDDLIAGGLFSEAGGLTVNRITRWDASSQQWQPLTSGGQIGVNNSVWALMVHNGDLVVAGQFTTAGSQVVNRIARWDGSTAGWDPLIAGGEIGVDGVVHATMVWNNNPIAAGSFTTAGGQTVNGIARWDDCLPNLGACCINDVAWPVRVSEDHCLAVSGTYQGDFTDPNEVTCPAACLADLTGDDVVNVFDLLDLLSAWGACP